jgi:hypothetical protein
MSFNINFISCNIFSQGLDGNYTLNFLHEAKKTIAKLGIKKAFHMVLAGDEFKLCRQVH